MGLMEHAIWWQVYPLGATGAPIRGGHGLPAHRLTSAPRAGVSSMPPCLSLAKRNTRRRELW